MNLEFISFSDPNEIKSKDARRRVRSHAMQHVRNRRRLANLLGKSNQNIQAKPITENLPRISSRNIAWHKQEPSENADPIALNEDCEDIAGAGRMEQLEVYPVSSTERYMFTIFHHCEYQQSH